MKKRFLQIFAVTILAIVILGGYLIWLGHVTRTAYLQSLERQQNQTP